MVAPSSVFFAPMESIRSSPAYRATSPVSFSKTPFSVTVFRIAFTAFKACCASSGSSAGASPDCTISAGISALIFASKDIVPSSAAARPMQEKAITRAITMDRMDFFIFFASFIIQDYGLWFQVLLLWFYSSSP